MTQGIRLHKPCSGKMSENSGAHICISVCISLAIGSNLCFLGRLDVRIQKAAIRLAEPPSEEIVDSS